MATIAQTSAQNAARNTTQNSAGSASATPQILLEDHLQAHWSQSETNNVKMTIDFVQHLMNAHDFDYIREQFGKYPYKQHNRSMTDGIQGVVEAVGAVVKRYPEYSYDVRRIIASGEYVVLHSHITMKAKHRGNEKKGFIITDHWRFQDGQIVEHWDAVQPLNGWWRFYVWMTGGKIQNSNGL